MTRLRFTRFAITLAVTGLLVAGCASGGGGASEGVAAATGLTVVNSSNETIYRVFLSPTRQRTWGPDQLGANVIARGATYNFSNITPGRWDVRVVDRSGNYKEFRNQNFRAGQTYLLRVNSQGWHRGG